MIGRALLVLAAAAAILVPAGSSAAPATYSGTIRFLPSAEPSGIDLRIAGSTVTITLGPGHLARAQVWLRRSGGTLRFSAPGLPKPLTFVLRQKGARLTGSATQGDDRATVSLVRGRPSPDTTLGYFSSPRVEVTRFTRFGFSASPFAIDLDTGAFRAPPPAGARLDVHQYEVRIRSGTATLAGTLTVPPGPGPHPAVVYVSGSGPSLREESHWLDGVFVSRGVAVLAYDKRGIGQSGGRYPGSLASAQTIATLAGDAAAAARFVAAQDDIDPARVGLYGLSQGGWIIPQAAVRAGGTVSWALIQSGPTVTQGESDGYAQIVSSGVPFAEAEAQARALGPSGYDPRAWIERLSIPVLWLYAGQDRAQPTGRSMEILRSLSAGHDFTTVLYPAAPHPLFDADGFPAGLFGAVGDWLAAHNVL